MGLIFPWSAVQQGRIPTYSDLITVRDDVFSRLVDNRSLFKAGMVWGSLQRGDFDLRSDLDLLLVSRDRSSHKANRLVSDLRRMARESDVVIDVHVCTSRQARLGLHDFGPSFLQTFELMEGQPLTFGPVGSCFQLVDPPLVEDEMHGLVLRKLRATRSRSAHFQARSQSLSYLEGWLERAWVNVIRPMRTHVTLCRRLLWWEDGSLLDDAKSSVVNEVLNRPQFHALTHDIQEMCALGQRYDELLAAAMNGGVTRTRYLRQVGTLLRNGFCTSITLLSRSLELMSHRPEQVVRAA